MSGAPLQETSLGLVLADFSKLHIEDGVIHYELYGQDGTRVPMTCADNQSNRLFVSWVQKFDRSTNEAEYLAAKRAGAPP